MSLVRWALSILAFPIGGWIAIQPVGSVNSPFTAASAGAIAGAVIGAAQALALARNFRWRWLAGSVVGMAAGSAAAAVLTSAATTVAALAISGLIAGLIVGAVQGIAARWGWRVILVWVSTVGLAWSAGWVITANVITDNVERGFITFGLSGAALVTVVTALVLRGILGPITKPVADATHVTVAEPVVEASR
jgi:hypothetical protein